MKDKFIYFSNSYKAIPDNDIVNKSEEFMKNDLETEYKISNALFIDCCRVWKKKYPDKYNLVVYFYDDNNNFKYSTLIDKDGRFENIYPELEIHENILMKLF